MEWLSTNNWTNRRDHNVGYPTNLANDCTHEMIAIWDGVTPFARKNRVENLLHATLPIAELKLRELAKAALDMQCLSLSLFLEELVSMIVSCQNMKCFDKKFQKIKKMKSIEDPSAIWRGWWRRRQKRQHLKLKERRRFETMHKNSKQKSCAQHSRTRGDGRAQGQVPSEQAHHAVDFRYEIEC